LKLDKIFGLRNKAVHRLVSNNFLKIFYTKRFQFERNKINIKWEIVHRYSIDLKTYLIMNLPIFLLYRKIQKKFPKYL
jgi:hypothetical protein